MNNSTSLPPITIFAFNRPDNLQRCMSSLADLESSRAHPIRVYIDGPRTTTEKQLIDSTQSVAEQYRDIFPTLHIFQSAVNRGCRISVIEGVSETLAIYESVIVVEDDLVLRDSFLQYMCRALIEYRHTTVGSVSGFSLDIGAPSNSYENYFLHRPSSWGWGTWREQWNKVSWTNPYKICFSNALIFNRKMGSDCARMLRRQRKGSINSWAIDWAAAHFRHKWIVSYPWSSGVINDGFGIDATHCKSSINPYPASAPNVQVGAPLSTMLRVGKVDLCRTKYFYSVRYKLRTKVKLYLTNLIKPVRPR